MMTKEEIIEHQRKQKLFMQTELGRLFERFVVLHGKAWQLDERSSDSYGGTKAAKQAWKDLEPVETELRKLLMYIAMVE
jgi:hypothetical protein